MLLKPLLLLTSLTLTLAAPQNKGRPWSDGADDISADSNRDFKREDTHWRRGDETDSVRITGGEAAGQGGYYVEADSGWNPKEKRDSVRITGEGEEGPEKGHEWGRKKRDDSVRITGDEDGPEEGSEWSRKKRESVRITEEGGVEGPNNGHEWGRVKRDSVRITGEEGPEEETDWGK